MKAELRRTPFRGFASVFRFFLLVSAAIGFFSLAASAQTVDEVIAKNIRAKGGADKLKSVRTIRTTAKFSQGSFRADRKSTRLNSSHTVISYAVFCLKKKNLNILKYNFMIL